MRLHCIKVVRILFAKRCLTKQLRIDCSRHHLTLSNSICASEIDSKLGLRLFLLASYHSYAINTPRSVVASPDHADSMRCLKFGNGTAELTLHNKITFLSKPTRQYHSCAPCQQKLKEKRDSASREIVESRDKTFSELSVGQKGIYSTWLGQSLINNNCHVPNLTQLC